MVTRVGITNGETRLYFPIIYNLIRWNKNTGDVISWPNHLRLSHNVNYLQKPINRFLDCKFVIKIKLNVMCSFKEFGGEARGQKMVCA